LKDVKNLPGKYLIVPLVLTVIVFALLDVILLGSDNHSEKSSSGTTYVIQTPLSALAAGNSYAVLSNVKFLRPETDTETSAETITAASSDSENSTDSRSVSRDLFQKAKPVRTATTAAAPGSGALSDKISVRKGENDDLTDSTYVYKDAFSVYNKKYSAVLKIDRVTASDASTLYIDKSKPAITLTSKKKIASKGDSIADHAEELATHEPQYRYQLGGRSLSTTAGSGIDCAHFVGRVYHDMGIDITSNGADANVGSLRTVLKDDIVKSYSPGNPISLSDMRRGDIIIFFSGGSDSHTAIYIGDGKIAHAADYRLNVCVTDMRYNESTGIAGYNGKTVQYIIRPAKDKVQVTSGTVKVEAEIQLIDSETGKLVSLDGLQYGVKNTVTGKDYVFKDLTTGNDVTSITGVRNSQRNNRVTCFYRSQQQDQKTILDSTGSTSGKLRITMEADSSSPVSWMPEITAK
jgi:cell wall-associated NlpC family hydrolase